MITTYIRELLGNVPSAGNNYDYSVLEYIVSATVLIFLCSLAYRVILTLFKWDK